MQTLKALKQGDNNQFPILIVRSHELTTVCNILGYDFCLSELGKTIKCSKSLIAQDTDTYLYHALCCMHAYKCSASLSVELGYEDVDYAPPSS